MSKMTQQNLPKRRRFRLDALNQLPNERGARPADTTALTRGAKPQAEIRPAGTQSIETAMQVLLALADIDQPIGVTEIGRRLGLHKSMVSRQLAMLKVADFVTQDSSNSRYALGLGLLPLAAKVLSAHRLSGTSRVRLEALAKTTREIVTMSGWDGRNAINLDQFGRVDPKLPLAPPGRLNPAHCTATGKAFLAELNADALANRLSEPLARYTKLTITDPRKLRAEIDEIRRTGLAINHCEFIENTDAIATLVRPHDGARPYAIAITLPSPRANAVRVKAIGKELLKAAQDLAREV